MSTLTTIDLALRDWDWLTPLRLGDISTDELRAQGFDLRITPVAHLDGQWQADGFAGAEVSLSKTSRSYALGELSYDPTNVVLMQGFRHRCVIVAKDSDYTQASDLVGKRIGVTGWPDSGNTWTRTALQDDGLKIDDATWFAGRLTEQHPEEDRLDGFGVPGRIEEIHGKPMADRLADGELDAVLTPFMPAGFYNPDSPWRRLYTDVRTKELEWAATTGYVPAHHVLAFDSALPPEVRSLVVRALDESRQLWRIKREKYVETSAWLAVDFGAEAELPAGWDQVGSQSQTDMFEGFFAALKEQNLTDPNTDFSTMLKKVEIR
jgi:4,5-dihydroxyphthalate decarboxylase